jgi:uncharacterized protein YggE
MVRLRKFVPVLVALALILGACSALPGGQKAPETIFVSGVGKVSIPPDLVVTTLGVQTQGIEIAQVVDDNNRRSAQVRSALSEAGVAEADMQTTYFNVSSQPKYDEFGNPTGETLYYVDNTVTVKVRNVEGLGATLQAALTAGANSVQGVSYTLEDSSQALDQARQLAIADAQDQAELLAASAGVKLGKLYSMSDYGGYAVSPMDMVYGKGGAAANVPTTPGTLLYQAQVSVSYEIQ